MKAINRQAQAWKDLLSRAQAEPVTVTFCGIDSDEKPLYMITGDKGRCICLQDTERGLVDSLRLSEDRR